MLLNIDEITNLGTFSTLDVRVYLPDNATVGDIIKLHTSTADGQSLPNYLPALKQADIDRGYYLLPGSTELRIQGVSSGENTVSATLYQNVTRERVEDPPGSRKYKYVFKDSETGTILSETELASKAVDQDSFVVYEDKDRPGDPIVSSLPAGAGVTIDLPAIGTSTPLDVPNPNGGTYSSAQTEFKTETKVGDWVIINARGQELKIVRGETGWTMDNQPSWLHINGNQVTIDYDATEFPYGSEVTAQLFDAAENESELVRGYLVKDALTLSDLKVINTDKLTGTSIIDTDQSDIQYQVTMTGQEVKDVLVKVDLLDANSNVVATQYLDVTADKETYTGTFTGVSGDEDKYTVKASVIDKETKALMTDNTLASKTVDVMVDTVAPTIGGYSIDAQGITTATIQVKPGTKITTDGNTYFPVASGEWSLPFGSVTEKPSYTVSDTIGHTITVLNPNYDWLMRAADDRVAENPNATDHAPGWSNTDRKFYWNGSDTQGDTIIAAPIQTDGGDYGNAWKRGAIGTEDGWQGFTNGFELNTRGGGSDYIQSRSIVGYTRIYTNDGDDKIVTDFMHGTTDTRYFGDFDGSQQIYMGSGNDSFTVQRNFHAIYAADDENKSYAGDWAGMFATNAKIDMGDGNDTVTITEGIYADNQRESGNYFNLGAGDDTMTTGTISSKPGNWEGSNIINLGTGNDTLTVNGAIESYGDNIGNAARFVLYSEDSSTVKVTGRVSGRVSMLMGNGNDNISVEGNFGMSTDSNEMNWLWTAFNGADTRIYESYGYYGPSFYDGLRSKVEAAFARSNAVDDSTGGNLHLHDSDGTAARVDLGNGNNTFWVKGETIGARIVGGQDADVIKLGTDPDNTSSGGINPNATVSNTLIGTSDGNDSVTLVHMQGGNYVNTGEGNDSVEIHGVQGLHNTVDTGAGNDHVTIYGTVATSGDTSNPNAFNLGAGYDVLSLGANGNTDTNNFSVGATVLPNYAQVLGVEEIAFNGQGATVRIDGDLGTTGVQETLLIHNTANGSNNEVDLNGSWHSVGATTKAGADGTSYNVTEYHSNDTNDIIYIQSGINIVL